MRCGSDDLVHWHGSIAHQGGAAFARKEGSAVSKLYSIMVCA